MKKFKIVLIFFVIILFIITILFLYKSKKRILYAPVKYQYKIIEKVDENGNEIIDIDKYNELLLILYNNKEYMLKNKNVILEKGKYFYIDNNVRFNSYKEYVSTWQCNISSGKEFSNCDKYSSKFLIKNK